MYFGWIADRKRRLPGSSQQVSAVDQRHAGAPNEGRARLDHGGETGRGHVSAARLSEAWRWADRQQ